MFSNRNYLAAIMPFLGHVTAQPLSQAVGACQDWNLLRSGDYLAPEWPLRRLRFDLMTKQNLPLAKVALELGASHSVSSGQNASNCCASPQKERTSVRLVGTGNFWSAWTRCSSMTWHLVPAITNAGLGKDELLRVYSYTVLRAAFDGWL